MKTFFGVFNTDQVNKYGHCFTVSALEDGMWQAGVYGMPTHMSHDMHRLIGWAIPFGLYFEPGITYTVGRILIADNNEDSEKIYTARWKVLLKRYSEAFEPHKEVFIGLLGSNYSENGTFHYPSCAAYISPEILYAVFPDLKELAQKEKAGLIYLSDLLQSFEYLSQGVFKHKESDLAVFANSFFRRSLSRLNNFHFEFLDELVALHCVKDVTVRISLDTDMIGYAPSFLKSYEYEYWWGPKYSDDIANIPSGPTQYRSDEFEKLYYGIVNTDFNWKHSGNNYEFELEEVRNEPAPELVDTYGCRYVHSIYEKKQECFNHFDGAIRSYNKDLMLERLDSKLTDFGRRSVYTKIFRVDGKLPLAKWKSLVTNYLQGNPQIFEYFGLEKPEVRRVIEEAPQTVTQKLVPYAINKGEGIRMLVSYHEQAEKPKHDRLVSIFDSLSIGSEIHNAVEYDVFELKKALNRLDTDLFIPDNLIYLIPEDMYCNIPCVFHSDRTTQDLLNDTLTALKNLFTALVQKGNEKVFSFTLAWNMEDKEVLISVLGHVTDIVGWMDTFSEIPTERDNFKKWLEDQAKYLSVIESANKSPELSEIIKYDGVLYLKRRPVDTDVNINYEPSSEGLKFKMKLRTDQSELLNAIKNGEVFPVSSAIADEIICEKDGKNYKDSQYSTYLDDGVFQRVSKHIPIGMFWSDKPA
ncbi:MAG: hypothetical protein NT175_04155 [Bacteroidetes bacterium]|nr:hypothetical protein [Bacteroidota bacterium]